MLLHLIKTEKTIIESENKDNLIDTNISKFQAFI